jgi:hypothetical protein
MRKLNIIFGALLIMATFSLDAFAQTADTTATTGGSGFIDLSGEAVRIKAEPEKPRVSIFSDRIRPQFDEVNLEKSFMPELLGYGEKIILMDPETLKDNDREIIDVNKIVERRR